MNRMWEIREGYEPDRHYGMRSKEDKAYECGYEHGYEEGYEEAMKEIKATEYGERRKMRKY